MIAPAILDAMLDRLDSTGDPFWVFAALTAGQDSSNGTWDEATLTEVSVDGYVRGQLPLASLTDAELETRFNQVGITFGTNQGGAAITVTHLAMLAYGGTVVLTLMQLANPVTTGPNQPFVVPTAGLRLTAQ